MGSEERVKVETKSTVSGVSQDPSSEDPGCTLVPRDHVEGLQYLRRQTRGTRVVSRASETGTYCHVEDWSGGQR